MPMLSPSAMRNTFLFNDTQKLLSQLQINNSHNLNISPHMNFKPNEGHSHQSYEHNNHQSFDPNLVNISLRRLPHHFNLVEIPGIDQGVNSHGMVFVLMTQENILSLNTVYTQYNVLSDNARSSNNSAYNVLSGSNSSAGT